VGVIETFFSIHIADMDRVVAFYTDALGATASHRPPPRLHVRRTRGGSVSPGKGQQILMFE
jgi:predicted enzyme related to lactoylglutathione lyase